MIGICDILMAKWNWQRVLVCRPWVDPWIFEHPPWAARGNRWTWVWVLTRPSLRSMEVRRTSRVVLDLWGRFLPTWMPLTTPPCDPPDVNSVSTLMCNYKVSKCSRTFEVEHFEITHQSDWYAKIIVTKE